MSEETSVWRKWPDVHPPRSPAYNLNGECVGEMGAMVLVAALSERAGMGLILLLGNYSYIEERWVFEGYEDGGVGSHGYDADELTVHYWAPIPDVPEPLWALDKAQSGNDSE